MGLRTISCWIVHGLSTLHDHYVATVHIRYDRTKLEIFKDVVVTLWISSNEKYVHFIGSDFP